MNTIECIQPEGNGPYPVRHAKGRDPRGGRQGYDAPSAHRS
ncbi:hypothetical protein [Azospirillum largimobile]